MQRKWRTVRYEALIRDPQAKTFDGVPELLGVWLFVIWPNVFVVPM